MKIMKAGHISLTSIFKNIFKVDSKHFFCISSIILIIFIGIVYWPSLYHIARADQIAYLADMQLRDSDYLSVAVKSYDFTRSRLFVQGDYLTFRPLLYFILGNELYFFGYQFMYWQCAGIVLHMITVLLLFKVLFTISRNAWVILFPMYFAFIPSITELVTWHHLNSYLIFAILILLCIHQAHFYIVSGEKKFKNILIISIALLFSVFIYEMTILFSILFTIFIYANTPKDSPCRLRSFILLIPSCIYIIINAFHIYTLQENAGLGQLEIPFLLTLKNFMIANLTWFMSGAFPFQTKLSFGDRMMSTQLLHLHFLTVLSIFLGVLYFYLFIKFPNRKQKHLFSLSNLILGMLFVYGLGISFGRLNELGYGTLRYNVYYSYIYWMLLTLWLCITIDLNKIINDKCLSKIRSSFLLIIIIVTLLNAKSVFDLNIYGKKIYEPLRNVVMTMNKLSREYSGNFAFTIDPSVKANIKIDFLKRKNDDPGKKYTYLEAIFLRNFSSQKPASQLTQ